MNKRKIFIISLLLFFFISLSAVSAFEDVNDTVDLCKESIIQSDCEGDILNSGETVVVEGDSIQEAIDNASPGSTIIVEAGNYSEDLVISKEISLIGQNATLKSESIAFNILRSANSTSISGFNIIVSGSNGTGVLVNASDCKITDNRITGGGIGIFSEYTISNNSGEIEIDFISNLVVLRNYISNLNSAGISVASFNPYVSKNNVSNIINSQVNGTAVGIKVNGIGVISDDLNVYVTDNRVYNVKSSKDSAYGFDIGGNSIFDTLVDFDVSGNTVSNVVGAVESYGAKVGVFSLNTTLPTIKVNDINITRISSGNYANASVVGLSVSVTTIGQNDTSDSVVQNIYIDTLSALGENSTATAMDVTGVGCTDLYIKNNNITNVKSDKQATGISASGIEYTNFNALVEVSDNNISKLKSSKVKGINAFSLGNIDIYKNYLYSLKGDDSTFITGVPLSFEFDDFNITIPQNATIDEIIEILNEFASKLNSTNFTVKGNLTVTGNNLEGSGKETAFAVVQPSEIHYNRAVNFKYNVVKDSTRKFLLESYGYDPDMSNEELAYLLLKSQQQFENCTEEELRNMSVSLGAFLDKFFGNFDNLTSGKVNAKYNWWGTNSKPSASKFKSSSGKILYNPWLTLRVTSNPQTIKLGQYSKITADVYTDSDGEDHRSDASLFFSGPRVTLSTDRGTFNGKKSVTLDWVNGKAIAYLEGDEAGLANVSATDYETAYTSVVILGENNHINKSSVKAESVKTMHATGNPLVLLLAGLLSFVCVFKRK